MRGSQISQHQNEENKSQADSAPQDPKKESPEVQIEKKDGKMRRWKGNKDKKWKTIVINTVMKNTVIIMRNRINKHYFKILLFLSISILKYQDEYSINHQTNFIINIDYLF